MFKPFVDINGYPASLAENSPLMVLIPLSHKSFTDSDPGSGSGSPARYCALLWYVKRVKLKMEEIFSCPKCGISPSYLVGDRKCDIAPLQCCIPPGVKEFSSHPSDPSAKSLAFEPGGILPDLI